MPAMIERFFTHVGRFFQLLGRVLAWTPRPPYDVREWMRQMVRVGVDSIPVVLLTAMFTGHGDGAANLHRAAPLQRRELRGIAGGALHGARAGPVLGGLIVAGRAGSAMGAELGTMRVTEQIDAWR
jgi:phospholipid/cholesterol/gamma-HCH transport system permease protein